jgi:hypothetical protein
MSTMPTNPTKTIIALFARHVNPQFGQSATSCTSLLSRPRLDFYAVYVYTIYVYT